MVLGAVLAGGRSRRFGRDKSVEPLGGVTMLDRAVRTLSDALDIVVVVTSPSETADVSVPVVHDLRAERGPLGGLEAALVEAHRLQLAGVFLMGCDLPLVTGEVVREVVEAWDGRTAAVAPSRAGGIEPLCAIYGSQVLSQVRDHLDTEKLSLHDLFRSIEGVVLEGLLLSGKEGVFLNVNTPEDLARAESRLLDQEG
jgi:molybdopterin-guanine dinucleotide biosynthesis protein A